MMMIAATADQLVNTRQFEKQQTTEKRTTLRRREHTDHWVISTGNGHCYSKCALFINGHLFWVSQMAAAVWPTVRWSLSRREEEEEESAKEKVNNSAKCKSNWCKQRQSQEEVGERKRESCSFDKSRGQTTARVFQTENYKERKCNSA